MIPRKNPDQASVTNPKSKEGSTGPNIDTKEDDAWGDTNRATAKVSTDNESVAEPSQDPIDSRVHKLIRDSYYVSNKEFEDYRKINYTLYVDNARLKVRIEALAQRQHMQINREEQNTAYLVGLITHHLGLASSSAAPPVPPPPFDFRPRHQLL